MDIKSWMETVNYKISEGGSYGWDCFGDNAYCLDSYSYPNEDSYSVSMVFDTSDQTVFEFTTCDYKNNRAYRLINKEFNQKYLDEAKKRNIADNAWDDVPWIDLEVFEDWQEKTKAIIKGEDYDTRIIVPIDLDEQSLAYLDLLCQSKGKTMDEVVEDILREVINKHKELENKDGK